MTTRGYIRTLPLSEKGRLKFLYQYEGVMDTNLVCPLGVDRTEVIFDFYFADISEEAQAHNRASISVGQQIQDEDLAICKSVQRGLTSRAYVAGRL